MESVAEGTTIDREGAPALPAGGLGSLDELPRREKLRVMRNYAHARPDSFWLEEASRLEWDHFPTVAQTGDFGTTAKVKWFEDGTLNPTVSCLDRHVRTRPVATALIWEGQDGQTVTLSWKSLTEEVCRLANVMKQHGVRKGDRVAVHLPMIAQGTIAMLACARIGAVHMVLFGGFSAEGLAERLDDSAAVLVVTADQARRGAKIIPSKETMDRAISLAQDPKVRSVLVLRLTGGDVPRTPGRDFDYDAEIALAAPECAPEILAAEDPLFLLYTSGSTGKPKGLVHTVGGYAVWASFTQELIFDRKEDDIFWCTADISWITGHTYVVYGPLSNGVTTFIYEGLPSWPQPGRWWDIIDRHGITVFYTSPTAIRTMKAEGDEIVHARSLSSLRALGSVGEPISADAWEWFHSVVGRGNCPVIDTWWQTETGGVMIAPVAGATSLKPGSATLPLPGVEAVLLTAEGQEIDGAGEGSLCLSRSWPGQARTIWHNHDLFRSTYFSAYPGYYFTGDAARRDEDGYFWITGRVDDVVNVSGHRIGTAEIESAVMTGPGVIECAAIGIPHHIKGQGVVVFAVHHAEMSDREESRKLRAIVAEKLGGFAAPEHVYLVKDLPKTRSGKLVRRLLRKIATNELDALGDLSTLIDPGVVDEIIERLRQHHS